MYIRKCTHTYICITSDAQAIAHHPMTDAQLTPRAAEESQLNCYPLQNSLHTMSYGMEYPFGHCKSAFLILFPTAPWVFCCEWPWLCPTLLSSNYKHCCVINIFFPLEPKHSITPHTDENNSIPAETKASLQHTVPQARAVGSSGCTNSAGMYHTSAHTLRP